MTATYREITIKLPTEEAELYVELLEQAGAGDLEAYIQALILKEGRRLWHIERCKPKSSADKTPVGRPRLSAEELKIRELGQFLERVYVKLRGLLGGPDFDYVHGPDYERLGKLLETKDLAGLEVFAREQPWQKTR